MRDRATVPLGKILSRRSLGNLESQSYRRAISILTMCNASVWRLAAGVMFPPYYVTIIRMQSMFYWPSTINSFRGI